MSSFPPPCFFLFHSCSLSLVALSLSARLFKASDRKAPAFFSIGIRRDRGGEGEKRKKKRARERKKIREGKSEKEKKRKFVGSTIFFFSSFSRPTRIDATMTRKML